MINEGWNLNEIFIWYKPNHMPSSIKNRFSNSYEPVFLFSKNSNNIFSKKNKANDYSNILKINLQPTPYKHVAVYPEKLVENILRMVAIYPDATILDPFAGSGTTLKVVRKFKDTLNAIMIENHTDYIEIIKERSGLNKKINVSKYNFIPYHYQNDNLNGQLTLFEKEHEFSGEIKVNKKGLVNIVDNKYDYYVMLNKFFTNSIKNHLNINATNFIGSKDFDIELIYQTSLLNNKGWVIRNMIIVENKNRWFPVFMLVDDNKKTNYIFNYKNLNLRSKTEYNRNWNFTDFKGYKVVSSMFKKKKKGKIIDIIQKRTNGFPEYVIVQWEDGLCSKEFVIFSQEEINNNLIFKERFLVKEFINYTNVNNYIEYNKKHNVVNVNENNIEKYNGKFKNEKRINWGASPGARSSVEQEYFSLQRLYEVDQNFIADYLNYLRIRKGISKQELTNIFPPNYKHTIGHWLRKDFGGSLPTINDWFILIDILDIEKHITNYVCKTALKIQTVKNAEYKTPEDFININNLKIFYELLENTSKHL